MKRLHIYTPTPTVQRKHVWSFFLFGVLKGTLTNEDMPRVIKHPVVKDKRVQHCKFVKNEKLRTDKSVALYAPLHFWISILSLSCDEVLLYHGNDFSSC